MCNASWKLMVCGKDFKRIEVIGLITGNSIASRFLETLLKTIQVAFDISPRRGATTKLRSYSGLFFFGITKSQYIITLTYLSQSELTFLITLHTLAGRE